MHHINRNAEIFQGNIVYAACYMPSTPSDHCEFLPTSGIRLVGGAK